MSRLLTVLVLGMAAAAVAGTLPRQSTDDELTAGVLRYDYYAAASLDSGVKTGGVIVYQDHEVIVPFHPGLAGRLRLRFTLAGGGEFGPCSVYLNDCPVAQTRRDGGATRLETVEGVSPFLSSRWNVLRLVAPAGRRIGLARIAWEPAEWTALPAGKVWRVDNPVPGRDFAWRLTAARPAELRIDGRTVFRVGPGVHTGMIPAAQAGAGRREYSVVTEGDFRLRLNRVDDVTILPGGVGNTVPPPPAPVAATFELKNAALQLTFSLPSPAASGIRFMAAGLTPSIRCGGVEMAGCLPDGTAGLAEEFATPAGYDGGKRGDEFLKFGIGVLRRGGDRLYSAGGAYERVKLFPWRVESGPDRLRFRQEGQWRDWGYVYEKTYRLDPVLARLRVEHRLRNTGRRAIVTSHYGHHLFRLGTDRIGPEHRTEFAFDFGFRQVIGDMARPEGRGFRIIPGRHATTFFRLAGFSGREQNFARISAGTAEVTIRGDYVPARIFFFCNATAVCPEFHHRLELEPGRETVWSVEYVFSLHANYHQKENKP